MCWVGRAAERCLDASSSVGGGRPPPPGPDTVCVGRTLTSVRSKKYMEKLLYIFLIRRAIFALLHTRDMLAPSSQRSTGLI